MEGGWRKPINSKFRKK